MASEVPAMYGMVMEVVEVEDWDECVESTLQQEWRWMKGDG